MIVQYMPQLCGLAKPEYAFKGEKVAVTRDGETAIFDLAKCEDGQYLPEPQEVGGVPVLLSARRKNGELIVELFYPIDKNAAEEERFPEAFTPEDSALPKGTAVKPSFVLPAPVKPTLEEKLAVLEGELLISYEAQAELFEQVLMMQEENLVSLEAQAELYEQTLVLQEENLITLEAVAALYEMITQGGN